MLTGLPCPSGNSNKEPVCSLSHITRELSGQSDFCGFTHFKKSLKIADLQGAIKALQGSNFLKGVV